MASICFEDDPTSTFFFYFTVCACFFNVSPEVMQELTERTTARSRTLGTSLEVGWTRVLPAKVISILQQISET